MKAPQNGRGRRAQQGQVSRSPRPAKRRSMTTGLQVSAAARKPALTHQHFLNLAREAASRGDLIEAETCYQYAEHYLRLAREGEG